MGDENSILTFEEAVQAYILRLDDNIPEESGSYNSFCTQCFYRNGHKLSWCGRCGGKMIPYHEVPVKVTWRQWISKAPESDYQLHDRLTSFIHHYAYKGPYKINFKHIWYYGNENCTTLAFVESLFKHLGIKNRKFIKNMKKQYKEKLKKCKEWDAGKRP